MENLIGKKFGRLKVTSIFKKDNRIYLECLCDCGKVKSFYKYSLTLGYTKSCGCLHSSLSSKRMNKNNPMWMPGIKEKATNTNKMLGTRPLIRGGNGQEMPVAQRVLLSALGAGWYAEHVVNTKMKRDSGYPTCYKIDIANPIKKIAIEVDGTSHGSTLVKQRDLKKEKFLINLGWVVIRFKNKEIMNNLELVLNKICNYTPTNRKF